MARQDSTHRLSGAVQLNDAYLRVERAGGKVRHGSENKVPFVAAVSVDRKGLPLYLKLNLVSGFTFDAVSKWAEASLTPGTLTRSNSLSCFAAVADAACIHLPTVVGKLKPRDLPEFKWVNTMLGNLKTAPAVAFQALKYSTYGERYLAASAYRFNRRFDLPGLVARLIVDVARTMPIKEECVRTHAEARF